MKLRKIPHTCYYLLELAVLFSGFLIISIFSYSFRMQAISLFIILVFYTFLGIFHHKLHHTARAKIMVEYILVSAVIFAFFLFINIGKI